MDVIASADAWESIGADIEANRRALNVAIEAAVTSEDLDAIDLQAGWQLS